MSGRRFRFRAGEARALAAAGDWILGSPEPPPAEVGLARRVELVLDACAPAVRLAFRVVLWVIEWGAVLGRLRPCSLLAPASRARYLEAWAHSRLYPRRMAFKIVAVNVQIAYYSAPAVRERYRFRPEALLAVRAKIPMLDGAAVPPPRAEPLP